MTRCKHLHVLEININTFFSTRAYNGDSNQAISKIFHLLEEMYNAFYHQQVSICARVYIFFVLIRFENVLHDIHMQ